MLDDYLKEILRAPVYDVARETPLDAMPQMSRRLGNAVWLKREDMQPVFSYKLRGAYTLMASLSAEALARTSSSNDFGSRIFTRSPLG